MKTLFSYSSSGTEAFVDAVQGETVVMDEMREYAIQFSAPLSSGEQLRFREIGGKLLRADFGLLAFRNFVGRTVVAGISVNVVSQKLTGDAVSMLLQEISAMGAGLIFSWKTPVLFEAAASFQALSPIPYHQFQFLRRSMLYSEAGSRLQDFLAAVERNPIRKFEVDRPVVPIHRVQRLDPTAMNSVFSRLDRLTPVPTTSPVYTGRLAQALRFGDPPSPHFPFKIAAATRNLSYDTPENRFVKHVLKEALALTYRFSSHKGLHASMRSDSGRMQSILENLTASPVMTEAGPLSSFRGPSQALAKADGYRDVFIFWNQLTQQLSLPLSNSETARLLEGRDIAKLYEYWVFLNVLQAALKATNQPTAQKVVVQRTELGESLGSSLSVQIKPEIIVRFNPRFSRSRNSAYSTPLRPDVILDSKGVRYAFDAKYRLERLTIPDFESDEEDTATYKQADLYKMHTYRDAISDLKMAVAVYPGTEFVFFERQGNKAVNPEDIGVVDGVGAVPLRPASPGAAALLEKLVLRCIND